MMPFTWLQIFLIFAVISFFVGALRGLKAVGRFVDRVDWSCMGWGFLSLFLLVSHYPK